MWLFASERCTLFSGAQWQDEAMSINWRPWELHLNARNFFPVEVSEQFAPADSAWARRHSWEAPFSCWDEYCSIFLGTGYLPGPALYPKEQQESWVCIVTSRLWTASQCFPFPQLHKVWAVCLLAFDRVRVFSVWLLGPGNWVFLQKDSW